MTAAQEQAKLDAYVRNAGMVGEVDAVNAARKAAAEAEAKTSATFGAETANKRQQRAMDAQQSLDLLD